jgi:SAM-dependent methyltransferase
MALEIARCLPRHSQVLDVGCGNGYIAHHLSALLGSSVFGIDLAPTAEASIDYKQFDSITFPLASESVDAVLLCYVLHHAQDMASVMSELKRVLRQGGFVVLYEDIPETWWDRLVCAIHDRKWRARTGPCEFRATTEWQGLFHIEGFTTINQRRLSRWRNLAHPVRRNFYLFKLDLRK